MRNILMRTLASTLFASIVIDSACAAIYLRPFSIAETNAFVTGGTEGGGWIGNTLTLFDAPSILDSVADFIPDDGIGIYFEFSATRAAVSGADVGVSIYQVDGNTVTEIVSDVATKTANPWYASVAGPGIPQRIDVLPQAVVNGVTTVNFFFAPETLNAPSGANVFDRIMFTTGHREYPESFTYGNVSWILAGSMGSTRTPLPNDGTLPELRSLAIWSMLCAVGAVGSKRRRI